MNVFLLGTLTIAAAIIGLFFLFMYFCLTFWILSANWGALAFVNRDEPQTALFALRLVAFGLIIVGIWNKNRRQPAPPTPRG
jgi:hypothetical protein